MPTGTYRVSATVSGETATFQMVAIDPLVDSNGSTVGMKMH
jgi:hypothetical protein